MNPPERSICFISPQAGPLLGGFPGAGGAERQFLLFGKALQRRGWDVSFIVNRVPDEAVPEARGFRISGAPLTYLGGRKALFLRDWWRLRRAVRDAGSRFVLLKTPGHLLLPLLFSLRRGQRLVFFGQTTRWAGGKEGWASRLCNGIEEWCVARCDRILAQSAEQAAGYEAISGRTASIIPSIIDMPMLPPCPRDIDVLWAGNSTPNKRFDILLEAARVLPDVRFAAAMLACDAAAYAAYRDTAHDLPNVTLLGDVPPGEMDSLYARSRLLVNTSDVEGFPNAFLQAFYHGAVVLSRRVNPDGVLTREDIGTCLDLPLVADVSDFAGQGGRLAEQIRYLLDDVETLDAMRQRAHGYVLSRHAPERAATCLEAALLKDGTP